MRQDATSPEAILGYCLEFQKRTFFSKDELPDESPDPVPKPIQYRLMSYFDNLVIHEMDTPMDYIYKATCSGDGGVLPMARPESRRFFLHCAVPEGGKDQFQAFMIPKDSESPASNLVQKPLMALISVKMMEVCKLPKKECRADSFQNCIQIAAKNAKIVEGTDYVVLESYGVDDLFIIVRGADPQIILRFLYYLNHLRCSTVEGCEKFGGPNDGGDFQSTIQTYTNIAFWSELPRWASGITDERYAEIYKVPRYLFELQLTLKKGASAGVLKAVLDKYFCFSGLSPGRHDLVAGGEINLEEMLQLYEEPLLNWTEKNSASAVQSSHGNFLYAYDFGLIPKGIC